MWSLAAHLAKIKKHLPAGFHASHGVRSLFPSGGPYSLTQLKNYVYSSQGYVDPNGTGSGPTEPMSGFVGADGAGRWFFGWDPTVGPDAYGTTTNARAQAGFVFRYPDSGIARGIVDTSRPSQLSCLGGQDSWIAQNWIGIFSSGASMDFQAATGFESLPDESNIWTNVGFQSANFAQLSGSSSPCTTTGSTVFPFQDFPAGAENAPDESGQAWSLLDLLTWFL